MSKSGERASEVVTRSAADRIFSRWREWWRRGDELRNLDRHELDRIAADLGMSARDLEDLVSRGPAGADLLRRRMAAMGLATADVERLAQGLMRDLQKTCTCCNEQSVCEKDLARQPDDPCWKDYCPNANSLEAIKGSKGRFPA